MPKIIKPESEEHWLKLKTEDISSTEVAALFNISPYSTPFEMWHQKASGDVYAIEDNERMRWGRRMEDTIAQGIAEDLGLNVRRLKTYMRHDTCKGMGSSFDYEIVSHESGPGLLEIKNVDRLVYMDQWDEHEAPAHIEAQFQHQCETANRQWGIIAALVGGNEMHYITRERNQKIGDAMVKRITEFWQSIRDNQPPEPNFEEDAEFIISMYGEAGHQTIDVSENEVVRPMVQQYYDLSQAKKDNDDLMKAVKARILTEVEDANKIICDDMSISCGVTKDTPPTVITVDMVGTEIGGRKGYRMFRIFKKKPPKKKAAQKAA